MTQVWLSQSAFKVITAEANRVYPLETGGILLGYFSENGIPVVVVAIGPGPDGEHKRTRFLPDHSWQCEQIDFFYEKSHGNWKYMGDWHTHPDGIPQMSWLDKRTLKTIAKHSEAKTSKPLMFIGGGTPSEWLWVCHQYRGDQFLGLIVNHEELKIHFYVSES
nr:Mov34/MPN/PAD-1 family protein [uncultured Pseudogulbenkiania sp.]